MEIKYRKELRNNYMIAEEADNAVQPYCLMLLEHLNMKGMLPVTFRLMDNQKLLYYDITGLQSMATMLGKAVLTFEQLERICRQLLHTIEIAYDYLLPEEDFILTPEHIYLDIATKTPFLCYYPGYGKDIRLQLTGLIEFLMNKVDYKDKEAVVLIYRLYAISKEEYSLEQLKAVFGSKEELTDSVKNSEKSALLQKDGEYCLKAENTIGAVRRKEALTDNQSLEKIEGNLEVETTGLGLRSKLQKQLPEASEETLTYPVMKERIEDEKEIPCYSWKSYLYFGGCLLIGILVILFCLTSGILFNRYQNQIDFSKLFALILLELCIEGYLWKRIFDKRNRTTKIIKTCSYVDPRSIDSDIRKKGYEMTDQENRTELTGRQDNEEEYDNPTCILNAPQQSDATLLLKALDEKCGSNIAVTESPFVIGKLKGQVNYCIDKAVISRYHAQISKEADHYYLKDLNSTNGTYVNQTELQIYEKKEIVPGDLVAFADLNYQVCMNQS